MVSGGGPGCQHRGCVSEAAVGLPGLHPDPPSGEPCAAASTTHCRATHSAVMQPKRVAKGRMSKATPTTSPRYGDWRERWKDTLCCRPAVGETGRSSVLPGCLLHPVLLCHLQAGGSQSKLWSPTTHNSSPAANSVQNSSCISAGYGIPELPPSHGLVFPAYSTLSLLQKFLRLCRC